VFRSLRFRLPAFFLAGVVLTAVVTALISVRLFQDYTKSKALQSLHREAAGLAALYVDQALRANDRGTPPPAFAGQKLQEATGDNLYYVGLPIFPGQDEGLVHLPRSTIDWAKVADGRSVTFQFVPPDKTRTYLAVANPVSLGGDVFGAIIVARPSDQLRGAWVTLLERLAIALVVALLIAAGLAWYLSRRVARPLLALSGAADEISRGNYGVAVPDVPAGDEIAELAQSFREMAQRLSEAEELERNFLMTVSHELRTPLTAIRGHVSALAEGLAEDPEAREASLDVIAREASRLERLVGDVLDLAKLDAHRFTVHREEVDMRRLLELAYAAFSEEARRRGIDYRQAAEAEPVIVTDGDRVLQIISNLLSNAFRWTPDGGRIDLSLEAENGTVAVAVGDTGPGIPPEERDRIFRPFWTRDGSGTGLGLAIARELAVALGGRIELESKPGGGSRFELVLPSRST
jgi:two-component system sensor histidine kinase BaeS